jgi:hypothetical protein
MQAHLTPHAGPTRQVAWWPKRWNNCKNRNLGSVSAKKLILIYGDLFYPPLTHRGPRHTRCSRDPSSDERGTRRSLGSLGSPASRAFFHNGGEVRTYTFAHQTSSAASCDAFVGSRWSIHSALCTRCAHNFFPLCLPRPGRACREFRGFPTPIPHACAPPPIGG